MKRVVLVLMMMLLPSLALAADPASPATNANTPAWLASRHESDPEPPPPSSPSRMRGVLAAFMVLSIIGFAVWTKTKKNTQSAKNPAAYVKVSDSVKVGEKAHLVVATIGDRTVVLGVTEHGVRRLMDVEIGAQASVAKKTAASAKRRTLKESLNEADEPEETDEKESSPAMLAASALKSRFQSIVERAKTHAQKSVRSPIPSIMESDSDEETSFDEEGRHWTAKLDEELRSSSRDADVEFAPPPGAVSAPLLRIANDTNDRVRMRLSGPHAARAAHTVDPLDVEEQVAGLNKLARTRRS